MLSKSCIFPQSFARVSYMRTAAVRDYHTCRGEVPRESSCHGSACIAASGNGEHLARVRFLHVRMLRCSKSQVVTAHWDRKVPLSFV